MRRPGRVILGTWLAMLTLQTIGTVDSKHKLPAPKQFVTVSVLWGTLFLLADFGYGKAAARFSLLVLLTATVLGPFGQRIIDFLNMIALRFGGVDTTAQQQQAPPQGNVNPNVRTA